MQIKSIAIENFKALRSTGTIPLKPLTVIIGNNGSGKSSLMEAVETYLRVIDSGVDSAMDHWQGFEHIRHKSAQPRLTSDVSPKKQHSALSISLRVSTERGRAKLLMAVNTRDAANLLYIQKEQYELGQHKVTRNAVEAGQSPAAGIVASDTFQGDIQSALKSLSNAESLLPYLGAFDGVTKDLRRMLFLRLNPEAIGQLQSVKRSEKRLKLINDGSNVAEYLIDLRERSPSAFEEIANALRYVLPYATDVEPKVLDAGILRRSYVQLLESKYEIPGWLMSSGSLRVLPLIATLLDPDPPPVVFIEEIENGLDPRTVGLVVDLMRAAAQSGRSQIIATTHSPYLLDMLDLDDVLLCERGAKGPTFSWPGSRAEMANWRSRFMPGRLYTMNALQQGPTSTASDATSNQTGEAPEGGWGDDA
jgi:predicted ATPase